MLSARIAFASSLREAIAVSCFSVFKTGSCLKKVKSSKAATPARVRPPVNVFSAMPGQHQTALPASHPARGANLRFGHQAESDRARHSPTDNKPGQLLFFTGDGSLTPACTRTKSTFIKV